MRLLLFVLCMWPPIHIAAADRIQLLKYEDRYALTNGKYEKAIKPELVSKPLRSMSASQLTALLNSGKAYVTVKQCDDGEFTMDLMPRTNGGGVQGAGFGGIAGEVVGKAAPLACGYIILYGTQGIIRLRYGKEASDEFGRHIVQNSLPHLHAVSEKIAHVGGGLGAIIGGLVVPG